VDVALGVVLGMVLAASLAAGWRLIRPPRVLDPGGAAMQGAVHAATTILPHLRRGLTPDSAESAAPPLRALTGADAVALAGRDALLAFDGPGHDHHRGGDPLETLVPARREERVHVEPRLACAEPGCPLRSAIVAPLTVRGARIGALVALYERPGRVRLEE
jgi:two-component system, LytTR family, sensor kinase